MKVRIIGAVVALLVAVIGTVVVIVYVNGADQRAAQGAELVPVYVVTSEVPEGSGIAAVKAAIAERRLPRAAIQPGRITGLAEISGKVTNAELLPGDQLVEGRFSDPEELAQRGDVPVPAGLEQITVALDVDRAAGGAVTAGSKVGVIIAAPDASGSSSQSRMVLEDVLVTRVQAGTTYASASASGSNPAVVGGSSASSASSAGRAVNQIMVTFAVQAQDATRIAWAAENMQKGAGIWLTLQNDKTATTSGSLVTGSNVLQ